MSKGVLGVGSRVQVWGPISLCLCAFLGLDVGEFLSGSSLQDFVHGISV